MLSCLFFYLSLFIYTLFISNINKYKFMYTNIPLHFSIVKFHNFIIGLECQKINEKNKCVIFHKVFHNL